MAGQGYPADSRMARTFSPRRPLGRATLIIGCKNLQPPILQLQHLTAGQDVAPAPLSPDGFAVGTEQLYSLQHLFGVLVLIVEEQGVHIRTGAFPSRSNWSR